METVAAIRNDLHRATNLVSRINHIIKRLTAKRTPFWLLQELDDAYREAQRMQQKFAYTLRDHEEEIKK